MVAKNPGKQRLIDAVPAADAYSSSVIGVGVDIVDIVRFAAVIERTPRLLNRVFTDAERTTDSGGQRSPASLAARFAAKEAVAKVLVDARGLEWHDCEVVTGERGEPTLRLSGTIAAAAAERGIDRWHLSLSHDGGMAVAYVVAERSSAG